MKWPWKKRGLPDSPDGVEMAQTFRRWGKQMSPPLPVSRLRVEYQVMRNYESVLAGLLPLHFIDPEKLTEEEMQALAETAERDARATICACATKPRFTEREDPVDSDQVCIDVLMVEHGKDLYFLYGLMMNTSHSRLAPADPAAIEREGISHALAGRQASSLGCVGVLCHFFPQLNFNHVLYKMKPDEFNIYWAAMEEAIELMKESQDGSSP